jgi:hypothetical protein
MVEAVSTSELPVSFYQTIRRNIPEDRHLQTRRRENLMLTWKSLISEVQR